MAALGAQTDQIENMMGHSISIYHDITMKRIEYLRGIYIASGLSMKQKTRLNKIDALKNHDIKIAGTISSIEREVDESYFGFLEGLVNAVSATNKYTISSVLVSRYLERIADHIVYVCESLVYAVTGEQVSLG